MTAANKYQITDNLFKPTKKDMTTEKKKMSFFQSPQGLVPWQNNIVCCRQQSGV